MDKTVLEKVFEYYWLLFLLGMEQVEALHQSGVVITATHCLGVAMQLVGLVRDDDLGGGVSRMRLLRCLRDDLWSEFSPEED